MLAASTPSSARITFRDALVRHGLLIPTGVAGVYGRGAVFEDTVERIDRRVAAAGSLDGAETLRFPPVVSRAQFARSGYLEAFPHLAGTIHAFSGTEMEHRALLRAVEAGLDWSVPFLPAAVVLTPAACYPVYPMMAGTLPPAGRLVDVMSYCFRHEPSDDPARMQMFRMHEHVRLADRDTVLTWREAWFDRVSALTRALGLDVRLDVASDPFFGRGGKLLAANQRERRLKLEVMAPIASEEEPSAIISLNYHEDHFSSAFGITTADGAAAHTGCVGFGLERIALALYRQHGFGRESWPAPVREELGL